MKFTSLDPFNKRKGENLNVLSRGNSTSKKKIQPPQNFNQQNIVVNGIPLQSLQSSQKLIQQRNLH